MDISTFSTDFAYVCEFRLCLLSFVVQLFAEFVVRSITFGCAIGSLREAKILHSAEFTQLPLSALSPAPVVTKAHRANYESSSGDFFS
jgi:hypothetical protein